MDTLVRIVQTSALIDALVATVVMVCAKVAVFQAGKANIVTKVCLSQSLAMLSKEIRIEKGNINENYLNKYSLFSSVEYL